MWHPILEEPASAFIFGAFRDEQEAKDFIDELIGAGAKNDLNNIKSLLTKHAEAITKNLLSQILGPLHLTLRSGNRDQHFTITHVPLISRLTENKIIKIKIGKQ